MADSLEKKIEALLQQGMTRQQIYSKLQGQHAKGKLAFQVNNTSRPSLRKKYLLPTLLLAGLLTFITFKKLLVIVLTSDLSLLLLLLSMIVPVINIYVLREVLRFRRTGYQFLTVISLLGLLHPENHFPQEMSILVIQATIAAFLYLTIFPSKEALKLPSP